MNAMTLKPPSCRQSLQAHLGMNAIAVGIWNMVRCIIAINDNDNTNIT
jgi:hypothetical protein